MPSHETLGVHGMVTTTALSYKFSCALDVFLEFCCCVRQVRSACFFGAAFSGLHVLLTIAGTEQDAPNRCVKINAGENLGKMEEKLLRSEHASHELQQVVGHYLRPSL